MWRKALMAACRLLSWMFAEEAHHRILNCHIDDHCNCCVSCTDRHQDPCHGYIVGVSWCWKKEDEEEKYGAMVSWCNKAASDQCERINGVIKGIVNECIVNELNCCVKERTRCYDKKHHCDVSFYPVDKSRILASPNTHTSNCVDWWELGTKNRRWQACRGVVDWHRVTNIIIAMSEQAFAFHQSFRQTSVG